MQPGTEGTHGAGQGDHGAGHGEHLHAEPPERREKRRPQQSERLKGILTGIGTIVCGLLLVAAVGWVVSRIFAISGLEEAVNHLKSVSEGKADKGDVTSLREKLDGKGEKADMTNLQNKVAGAAEALPVENEMNNQREEIEKLRQLVSTYNASCNNAVGKYDTLLQKHEAEVANLRSEASSLCEKVAKLETQAASSEADLKQIKDVQIEKLTADNTTLREKIASLEASLKSIDVKK